MAPASCSLSDALDRLQASGPDGLYELGVVPFVLVGVVRGEAGDRVVELVAGAQVGGDGDRVPGPGVGPRQRPPADACVEGEPNRPHLLNQRRALHVAQLPPVEVAFRPGLLWPSRGKCRWQPASSTAPTPPAGR